MKEDDNSIWCLCKTFTKNTSVVVTVGIRDMKQVSSNFCFPGKGVQIFMLYHNIIIILPLGFLIFVNLGVLVLRDYISWDGS